ncbi:consortin-like [Corythoichthys intestinalis]|uniref:consortin-like n=1 Tax=Corythoichthys intestinalis TaxID=161448 RepID=UPI0025A4DD8D|nr:consortin-like [Corythoichthys intestinalis]XP_057686800.1 consortin-like [Corythoichthys intestinalis]
MDYGGQLDYEGRIMSQVAVGGADRCDNTAHPEVLIAQRPNLNETTSLSQSELTSALQNDFETGLPSKTSLNNNGGNKELESQKSTEEEEDIDEVMKDEEEESEESSCQMHCQSPDTPMTDSSYSETGSMLENPFSPGTSPEPTSPIIQETSCPISPLDLVQSEVNFAGYIAPSSTPGHIVMKGPVLSPQPSLTSDTGLSCTDASKHISASTAGNVQSPEPFAFTPGHVTSCTQSSSVPGATLTHSDQETSSSLPISALMASLELLAQRGDDTCLPQQLHQIAEASVRHEDYHLALRCIQLEKLYHQRVLDNLNALQQQWERLCTRSSPILEACHLDTLRDICQTHARPSTTDAALGSLGLLNLEQGNALTQAADDIEGSMEHSHLPTPSINLSHQINSKKIDREAPECNLEGKSGSPGSELTDENKASGRVQGECLERTTLTQEMMWHPSGAGVMDQPEPAEQQGGDLGSAQEKELDEENKRSNVGEAAEAPIMEDETEEEEAEEERKELCGIAVTTEHLEQEAQVFGKEEITEGNESSLQQDDVHLPQETLLKHDKLANEEEEEDYESELADTFPEAVTLDDMAKLITVEEISPVSGLISILKKRNLPSDDVSLSEHLDKSTAKRRVRFKVADDGFESDVGGRDSCLLLFLLCLVTVVISMGGTTLYCALGDVRSSVCQDFSRNLDFYFGQMQRAVTHIQQWFGPSST